MNKKGYTKFWKKIGQTDPYFGVLTHPEYRSSNLNATTKEAFFASGKKSVDTKMRRLDEIWPLEDRKFSNALDFGCGTGRLSLALCSYYEQVTGVDVSEAMLAEAEKNKHEQNISNVTFVNIPDCPPFLKDKYDLIYSEMVFQHIPADRGMLILDHLLDHLLPGGYAFIQFTYNNLSTSRENRMRKIIFTFPRLGRLLTGSKDYFFPMFDYDLNKVFTLFQKHDIHQVHQNFGSSGNHQFVRLYLNKRP